MAKNINRSNGKKLQTVGKNAIKIGKTPECTKGSRVGKPTKQEPMVAVEGRQRLGVQCLLQKLEAAKNAAARRATFENNVEYWIGIDLGDKKSNYCILDKNANIVAEGSLATTVTEFDLYFKAIPRSRMALEVGTHSPWTSSLLERLGHSVCVANPRKIGGGKKKGHRKNDKLDARTLARLLKADPNLLYPIQHRGEKARHALVLLRARQAAVEVRTKLICAVRGLVKSDGKRLPRCSAESFHKIERTEVPEALRATLEPLFKEIKSLTEQIKEYDKEVKRMCQEAYPETELVRQVDGVGAIVGLAFILTLDNPGRFAKSRDVGAYLGLIPRQYDSGDSRPQMRITKTGDRMMRALLVQSAQHILGRFGKDSDLRRHGLKIAARGGKNAKKRAITAVARKLSVLLHSLWVTAEVYEPLRNSTPKEKVA
jgi:transposase